MKLKSAFVLAFLSLAASGSSSRAGFEIADLTEAWQDNFRGYTKVWIDYGDHRITAEEWESYEPSPGYLKNTPRHAHFNEENTFSSPGMPYGQILVETIDSYTWKFIAQTQSAVWPYNTDLYPDTINAYQAAAIQATPAPGSIRFSSNEKNQEMIFWAREGNNPEGNPILRYFITDTWGNQYIMGASGASLEEEVTAAFWASELPSGWSKSTGFLPETLSLMPAIGPGNQAHYNLFRENSDNTFFQIVWGEDGESIAAQIAGMPIWGGLTDDRLAIRTGDDNQIYGGGGLDTVIFIGNFSDWSITQYVGQGAELTLSGFGFETTLYDIAYLQFADLLIATSAIPEPSTLALVGMSFVWWRLRRRSQIS